MVRAAFLTFAVLLASVAPAQMGMGSRATSGDLLDTGAGFLMVPSVQKEVGLSASASQKITSKYLALIKSFMPPAGSPPGQRPNVNIQDAMKKVTQVQKDALALLNPTQKTRLKQITIQQMGSLAFLNPEVKKGLGLTADQTRRIDAIVKDGSLQLSKEIGTMKPPTNQSDMLTRTAELSKKQDAWKTKMLKESTKSFKPDQLAKWKAMQGKPFKIDMMGAMRSMQRMGVGG